MATDFGIPPVVGDPAGMRALAAKLRGQARQVNHVEASVRGAVECMTFEGPAARTFRSGASAWRGQARGTAGEIEDIASILDRTAGKVERQQADRKAAIDRLQRAEDEKRREAQRDRL